jgi:hypothetical protein
MNGMMLGHEWQYVKERLYIHMFGYMYAIKHMYTTNRGSKGGGFGMSACQQRAADVKEADGPCRCTMYGSPCFCIYHYAVTCIIVG